MRINLNNEELIKKNIIKKIERLIYYHHSKRSIIYAIFKDLSIDKLNSIYKSMKRDRERD